MRNAIYVALMSIFMIGCSTDEPKNEDKNETTSLTERHKEFHPNGKIKIQGDLVKGIRQGTWESFYDNGLKWSESTYLFGKRNGVYKIFYPNGRLKVHGMYENEKKVDVWFFYRENGEFEKEINFNETPSK